MCSICAESGAESYASSPPSAATSSIPCGSLMAPIRPVPPPPDLVSFPRHRIRIAIFQLPQSEAHTGRLYWKLPIGWKMPEKIFNSTPVYCSQKGQISLAKLQKEAVYINSEQSRLSWEGWSTVFCLPCDNTFHWNGLFPYVQICKLTTFFKKIKQRKRTISILKLPSGFICE